MFENNPEYAYVKIVWASKNRTFYVYRNIKTGAPVFEEVFTGEILYSLPCAY
jgi:hypothetical protein